MWIACVSVLTFAKPECDVLQPELRATHYYTRAWANVKTQEKNVTESFLYTFSKTNTFEKSNENLEYLHANQYFFYCITATSYKSWQAANILRTRKTFDNQIEEIYRNWKPLWSGIYEGCPESLDKMNN